MSRLQRLDVRGAPRGHPSGVAVPPWGGVEGRAPGAGARAGVRAAARAGAGGWTAARAGADGGTAALLATLAEVVAAVRAGAAPGAAWASVGVRAVEGVPDPRALVELGATPQQVGAIRAAAEVGNELGAPPAAVLERVADGVRSEAEAAVQREAAFAGPRATARLLAWLPVVGLGLGAALGAEPWEVLVDGGGGTSLLGAGVALVLAGRAWTRRLVATPVGPR